MTLILIVDDSMMQRKIYSKLLTTNGYEVVVAENGIQGIEMALQHQPDLILMDISMPEMDGLTATHELRQYPEMAHVPIVAITAAAGPDDMEQAFQAGFTDVVDKNTDQSLLLETISHLLS